MRAPLMMVALLAIACDAPVENHALGVDPSAEPSEHERTTPIPRHGGAIVTLDGAALELIVLRSGVLHVHVRSEGVLANAGVTVTLRDEDGASHAVGTRRIGTMFVGQLEEAPALGEAEIRMLHEGRSAHGVVEVTHILPAEERGGAVLWLGERAVEVTVDASGGAALHVLDDATLEGELTLGLPGEDDALHPLALTWDEASSGYVGQLEGIDVQPGVLEVVLAQGATQHLGRGALLALRPDGPPALDAFEGLRLELPELGNELPAVIAVPPGDDR